MNAEYVQKGEMLDYKNSGSTKIKLGEVIVAGDKVFIAADDIEVGATGAIAPAGVYKMQKEASAVINMGTTVYYDAENDCITATATGNKAAGYAIATSSAADSTVLVKVG